MTYGLMAASEYQLFLAVAIVTMSLTPFLIMASPRFSDFLAAKLPWGAGPLVPAGNGCETETPEDHLIIVGFGVGGRHLARAARMAGIRYVVLEMNPDTVRNEGAKGEPISYGDAAQPAVLAHAGVARARILAVVIADPAAIRRITEAARKANPALRIVVRTRFVTEIQPLKALGANEVVPEEFETSIGIFTRVLATYLVPVREIERFAAEVRGENYGFLCETGSPGQSFCSVRDVLTGHEVVSLVVDPGAPLAGKSLKEAALRQVHGLTVVAVRRIDQTIANPEADFRLRAADLVYVFGEHRRVLGKLHLFRKPEPDHPAEPV
jgi:CPA2 family monovalent cation:H+ antiporter-2